MRVTKDELRGELAALRLTQAGLADYVGTSPRTVRRWATGEQDVPPWVSVVFRLLHRLSASEIHAELHARKVD